MYYRKENGEIDVYGITEKIGFEPFKEIGIVFTLKRPTKETDDFLRTLGFEEIPEPPYIPSEDDE
jgi:hypothetical protein